MSTKRRRRHSPEQIGKKMRDADAMLNAKLATYEAVAKQLGIDRRTVKSKIDAAMLKRL